MMWSTIVSPLIPEMMWWSFAPQRDVESVLDGRCFPPGVGRVGCTDTRENQACMYIRSSHQLPPAEVVAGELKVPPKKLKLEHA